VTLRLAFQALASKPLKVVATTARDFDEAEFGTIPSNVILERFVPFSEFVDRVSVAITHGGAGAVHAALSHGVPVIVLPFTADQFEVAARCAWAGVGIRLDRWTSTAEELREAVRSILSDPGYRARAQRISQKCARLNGADIAASLLERLAETRASVARPRSIRNPWEEGVAA
jgi:MGT family glycosyltransferase